MNTVLVPLGFGDEGKGSWSEYFAKRICADLSIRYNGGCQGYHFIRVNGVPHPANQFSAAMLARPKLVTVIGEQVPVAPISLLAEGLVMEEKFGVNALSRLFLMLDSPVVTPAHNLLCETRELYSKDRIGTAGVGVREVMADIAAGDESLVMRMKDFFDAGWREKFAAVNEWQFEKIRHLDAPQDELAGRIAEFKADYPLCCMLNDLNRLLGKIGGLGSVLSRKELDSLCWNTNLIFEPAQGTLLDREYGFKPHVTSTTTTVEPALAYGLDDSVTEYVGLCRAFMTRHGRGFFPTETDELGFADDNGMHEFQGKFRFGWLDLALLKYAIEVNQRFAKLSYLAVSHLDQLSGIPELKVCVEHDDGRPQYAVMPGWEEDITKAKCLNDLPKAAREYLAFIQKNLDVPIRYVSVGPNLKERFEIAL